MAAENEADKHQTNSERQTPTLAESLSAIRSEKRVERTS